MIQENNLFPNYKNTILHHFKATWYWKQKMIKDVSTCALRLTFFTSKLNTVRIRFHHKEYFYTNSKHSADID